MTLVLHNYKTRNFSQKWFPNFGMFFLDRNIVKSGQHTPAYPHGFHTPSRPFLMLSHRGEYDPLIFATVARPLLLPSIRWILAQAERGCAGQYGGGGVLSCQNNKSRADWIAVNYTHKLTAKVVRSYASLLQLTRFFCNFFCGIMCFSPFVVKN